MTVAALWVGLGAIGHTWSQEGPPWGEIARHSSVVVTARVEEDRAIPVIQPEKRVDKVLQRSDGTRLIILPREEDYLLGYVIRYRVEAVHIARSGQVSVGDRIELFTGPLEEPESPVDARHLLFLSRPLRMDAPQEEIYGGRERLNHALLWRSLVSDSADEPFRADSAFSPAFGRISPETSRLLRYGEDDVEIADALEGVRIATNRVAPTAVLVSPLPGATLQNSVDIEVEASDDDGVARVGLVIDGAVVGDPLTDAPYRRSWNTREAANGSHVIEALAWDVAWNETTSQAVTVTVSNTPANTLAVSTSGAGTGSVRSFPAGIDCGSAGGACEASFAAEVVAKLTPTAAEGFVFEGWSGACSVSGSCSVPMDECRSVIATFGLPKYSLTIARGGMGSGTVASSPPGISCGAECSALYTVGTTVTLTATEPASSVFVGWSGACTGTGACSVTMDAAQTVEATFDLKIYALTVVKKGTQSGTVTSSPEGIICGSTCTALYAAGRA